MRTHREGHSKNMWRHTHRHPQRDTHGRDKSHMCHTQDTKHDRGQVKASELAATPKKHGECNVLSRRLGGRISHPPRTKRDMTQTQTNM